MFRLLFLLVFVFSLNLYRAQSGDEKEGERKINIIYGANFTKDSDKFPGASIFSRDETRQVQFEHQGADMWCDVAVLYSKDNRIEAYGNIRVQQGDSVEMNSRKLFYNGNTRMAEAFEDVQLTNGEMRLLTDTLYFDRNRQRAYYLTGGTIIDSANVLKSRTGRYFLELKKYQFRDNVTITNPDYVLESERLDYFTDDKTTYMYGPSTITGEDYVIYCERGFYDTRIEQGYGVKNTEIYYDDRIIEGDSVYFDKTREFASATNNIKVTDTINQGVIRAHYAEVFKAHDSLFATRRAVGIQLVENDSMYIHGDTLMVTGPEDDRLLRAFHKARIYKTDLSGKCDTIVFEEKTGIADMIHLPILWNAGNQMTGDLIQLLINTETEKLDSLKVLENAFVISRDTIGNQGYNQAKGKDLFGKFEENELVRIDLIKNTEAIYYPYDSNDQLIGIDKKVCSQIVLFLADNNIEQIEFRNNIDGNIFPLSELPEESRLLRGFVWRGDERLFSPEDLFDQDDVFDLPVIRGLREPEPPENFTPETPPGGS